MTPTVESQRKPNPRGAGGRLRDEIVEAATRLVEDRADPSGITLRGIAREAGITAPSIYGHFGNLDAVMDAVVDESFGRLSAGLEETLSLCDEPVPRLRALCRSYVSFGVGNPRLYRLLFSRDQPVEAGPVAPKPVETMPGAHAFGLLVQAIEACVAAGRSTSIDPQGDATLLWTALHGYVSLLHSVPDFPWPSREDLLDQCAERLACITP
ncbi:TetR/AcrR family transcriptional regulator [Amycolatopsis sp. H6(2020)]|nr:TetR/AcrR family transcriptional regulator [Amycolatopsis sp. H6(2020)]